MKALIINSIGGNYIFAFPKKLMNDKGVISISYLLIITTFLIFTHILFIKINNTFKQKNVLHNYNCARFYNNTTSKLAKRIVTTNNTIKVTNGMILAAKLAQNYPLAVILKNTKTAQQALQESFRAIHKSEIIRIFRAEDCKISPNALIGPLATLNNSLIKRDRWGLAEFSNKKRSIWFFGKENTLKTTQIGKQLETKESILSLKGSKYE